MLDLTGLLTCTYKISIHSISCINNAGQTIRTTAAASGNGSCENNVKCVKKPRKRPLPPGTYSIYPPGESKKHPTWLYLEPDENNVMYNRDEFFIHPWGFSKGCIMLLIPHIELISQWAEQDEGGTLYVVE